MDKIVRDAIIKVLDDSLKLIEKEDFINMVGLSNQTIHNASIYQDEFSISVAVIISAITKLAKRMGYVSSELVFELKKAKSLLIDKRDSEYADIVKVITDMIKKQDSKMRNYIQEVLNKAQIKKGTRIYDQGISLARAAELLSISQWELMQYIGKTNFSEDEKVVLNIQKKLEFVRTLFNIEEK